MHKNISRPRGGIAKVLSLPLHPHLGLAQVDRVIEVTTCVLEKQECAGAAAI